MVLYCFTNKTPPPRPHETWPVAVLLLLFGFGSALAGVWVTAYVAALAVRLAWGF